MSFSSHNFEHALAEQWKKPTARAAIALSGNGTSSTISAQALAADEGCIIWGCAGDPEEAERRAAMGYDLGI